MRRRHSIIAPMILILIGGVFLVRNFFPEVRVGDLVASFWPYILIVWGAIRLGEIVVWTMQKKPLPRNGVTGGEWVLIVFLCIFGTAFHAVHHGGFGPFRRLLSGFGPRFDYTVAPVEKPCGPAPRIVIDNLNGYSMVTGADVKSVQVTVHKYIRSFQKTDADRVNLDTPVEILAQNNDLTVRTNQGRVPEDLEITTNLDIVVPNGASIVTQGHEGDITVSSLSGSVDVTSDSAAVRFSNIGGPVRVDLRDSPSIRADNVKGTVDLKGYGRDIELHDISGTVTVNGAYTGAVNFQHIEKPLSYTGATIAFSVEQVVKEIDYRSSQLTGSDIVGPIHIEGKSTNVWLSGFTRQLDVNLTRGTSNLVLRPGGAALPAMAVGVASGYIDLALPPGGRFDLSLITRNGHADNQYGSPLKAENDGRVATIAGGSGGPQLRLTTERGQVTVRKSTDDGTDTSRTPPPPARQL